MKAQWFVLAIVVCVFGVKDAYGRKHEANRNRSYKGKNLVMIEKARGNLVANRVDNKRTDNGTLREKVEPHQIMNVTEGENHSSDNKTVVHHQHHRHHGKKHHDKKHRRRPHGDGHGGKQDREHKRHHHDKHHKRPYRKGARNVVIKNRSSEFLNRNDLPNNFKERDFKRWIKIMMKKQKNRGVKRAKGEAKKAGPLP